MDPNQIAAGSTGCNLAAASTNRVEGESADCNSYKRSITSDAYIVESYGKGVMLSNYKKTLYEQQIADTIGYLLTLKKR